MDSQWLREPARNASVVFIHGVLSSSKSCWQNANGTTWPELVRNDQSLEGVGIYLYTYATSFFSGSYRLGDIVDDLKERIRLDRVNRSNHLVFICHSMGGIVARAYLVDQQAELIRARHRIGLFLVASPSLGSAWATWLSPLARLFGHAQARDLRFVRGNTWLEDLDKQFLNLKESGTLPISGKELVEDKSVIRPGFWWRPIVDAFSAARYFGERCKVQGSDHCSIAKPAGPGDIQHQLLRQFILDALTKHSEPCADPRDIPSVAVLPFVDFSSTPDRAHLCESVASEIASALGRVRGLRVTAFASSLCLPDGGRDVRAAGHQLDVRSVLHGSVRVEGDRIRVIPSLVSASDGSQLWSEPCEATITDLVDVQETIAAEIVRHLEVELTGQRPVERAARGSESATALEAYAFGQYHFRRRHQARLDDAARYFRAAVDADPRYAAAYAGLADCETLLAFYGFKPRRDVVAAAHRFIDRSIALAGNLAAAHHALGTLKLFLDWDWVVMQDAYERALELAPGEALTHAYFALALSVAGQIDRAQEHADRAVSLSPRESHVFFLAAQALNCAHRFDRSSQLMERAGELDPDLPVVMWGQAVSLVEVGDRNRALTLARLAVERTKGQAYFLSGLGWVLARAGMGDEARSVLAHFTDDERYRSAPAYMRTNILAALGDHHRVLDELERATETGDTAGLPLFLTFQPYDSVRGDPRFKQILLALKYESDWLLQATDLPVVA